jgi:hypothetical protein
MPQAMAIPLMIFPTGNQREQHGCRKYVRDLSLSLDHGPVLGILNTTGAGIPRVQGLDSTMDAGQEPMQSGVISTVTSSFPESSRYWRFPG